MKSFCGGKASENPVDRRMDANRQSFASARVIVTRPEPDASAFAAMVEAAGMTPVLSPAMEIQFQPKDVSFDAVTALAFTSANGVRALLQAPLPARVLALPVFTVGAASADAARKAGFGEVAAAGGDVASLAALIGESAPKGAAVLHISGSDPAGDLVGLLTASGIAVRRAELYAAKPAPRLSAAAEDALSEPSGHDWAAFFSPRTARLFIGQARASGVAGRLSAIRAACLSDAVAEAARGATWKDLTVADTPMAEAMINAITVSQARADP